MFSDPPQSPHRKRDRIPRWSAKWAALYVPDDCDCSSCSRLLSPLPATFLIISTKIAGHASSRGYLHPERKRPASANVRAPPRAGNKNFTPAPLREGPTLFSAHQEGPTLAGP